MGLQECNNGFFADPRQMRSGTEPLGAADCPIHAAVTLKVARQVSDHAPCEWRRTFQKILSCGDKGPTKGGSLSMDAAYDVIGFGQIG